MSRRAVSDFRSSSSFFHLTLSLCVFAKKFAVNSFVCLVRKLLHDTSTTCNDLKRFNQIPAILDLFLNRGYWDVVTEF